MKITSKNETLLNKTPLKNTPLVSFKNQLLIAMPILNDSEFNQSITIICEHNSQGAMGIVVNNALDLSTTGLLEQMDIPFQANCCNHPVLAGGPVQTDRGFVVHRSTGKREKTWKSTIQLKDNIAITTSSDILHAIASEEVSDDMFIALGYAGWGPGQLEEEIIANNWINIPLNADLIFNTEIKSRWQKATKSLGFEMSQLSFYSGNA